jgi:hypothetical protein
LNGQLLIVRFPMDAAPDRTVLSLLHAVGIYQYFTGFAGFQALHCFGKIFHGDAVGDYRMQI